MMDEWEKKWTKMKPYLKVIHLEIATASLRLGGCMKLKDHLAKRDEIIMHLERVIKMLKELKADDRDD